MYNFTNERKFKYLNKFKVTNQNNLLSINLFFFYLFLLSISIFFVSFVLKPNMAFDILGVDDNVFEMALVIHPKRQWH